MRLRRSTSVVFALMLGLPVTQLAAAEPSQNYVDWQATGLEIPDPLAGLRGDAAKGKEIVVDRRLGNCLACHRFPIEGESFQGSLGPSLEGVASRLSPAEIRLRVVDLRQINPNTVMPGYYRHPDQFNRVSVKFEGKTMLTAQQIEDVVAYLATLK